MRLKVMSVDTIYDYIKWRGYEPFAEWINAGLDKLSEMSPEVKAVAQELPKQLIRALAKR